MTAYVIDATDDIRAAMSRLDRALGREGGPTPASLGLAYSQLRAVIDEPLLEAGGDPGDIALTRTAAHWRAAPRDAATVTIYERAT